MHAFKKEYYLIIQSIKDIDLSNIKKRYKFTIIYRNNSKIEKITDLINFRRFCKKKGINFFVANNFKLAIKLKADGFYISANNLSYKKPYLFNYNFKIIGSAHNIHELNIKKVQGCSEFVFSRIFDIFSLIFAGRMPSFICITSRIAPASSKTNLDGWAGSTVLRLMTTCCSSGT